MEKKKHKITAHNQSDPSGKTHNELETRIGQRTDFSLCLVAFDDFWSEMHNNKSVLFLKKDIWHTYYQEVPYTLLWKIITEAQHTCKHLCDLRTSLIGKTDSVHTCDLKTAAKMDEVDFEI